MWGCKTKYEIQLAHGFVRPTFQPTSMEIGNVQNMRSNQCFVCHKEGCRAWKHGQAQTNNIELDDDENDEEYDAENQIVFQKLEIVLLKDNAYECILIAASESHMGMKTILKMMKYRSSLC